MEEPDKEKENRMWRWGLSILAIACFALLVYLRNTGNKMGQVSDEPKAAATEPEPLTLAITQYVDFVSNDTSRMSLGHDYSSEAMLKLLDATSAAAEQAGQNLEADFSEVKAAANRITENPRAQTHADDIRKAAVTLSGSLVKIQAAKYPALAADADSVKMAAEEIDPTVLMLNQKEVVNAFFMKAADLLSKMQ